MRTFRNSIAAAFALLVLAAASGAASNAPAGFFPLAEGNTWTYRCSAEGHFQFTKKVVIASLATLDGRPVYRAEMRTGTDPTPLVSYFAVDDKGRVMTSLTPTLDSAEPLMSAAPRIGDRFGKFSVVAIGPSTLKMYRQTDVARLENFSADDPSVSEEKRMEWRGRSYGRGIGLIEEADGLGGACVLSAHRLKNTK